MATRTAAGSASEPAFRLVAETGKPTMVLTRVFDAPRRLVFEAYSRPEHVSRWWGPRDYALIVCEMDFRPGGAWRFVLRAPDGREHPFKGVYREIEPPERLVYTFIYDVEGIRGHEAVETLAFEERDGRTTLTNTMVHKTVEARDGHLQAGMEAGASETLERLAEILQTMDREIVISRVFDAPRELVWEVWTDPKHVVHWWGPNGFTTTIETMDVRRGGVWKHVMHGPDGTDYPNKSAFKEVVKPERIVYSHGGGREGGPGTHFEATWTFDALEGNKTRLTGRMVFASAADREHVVREFNAIEGGRQTLGRLAGYLARMR
jgi:uncharacterized protein YndB with AHSA1/START domain